jgi:hypothetical protein
MSARRTPWKHRPHTSVKSSAMAAANDCSTNKLGFDTKQTARTEAAVKARAFGVDLAIYRCPECRRWHLTTDSDRTTNGTRR